MSVSKIDGVVRLEGGAIRTDSDLLADEEPLEIRVRGRSISVTMRTPGHDEELAVGFLLTEGVIRAGENVRNIQKCERNEFGNVINVQLAPEVSVDFERLTRHVFSTSSCGLCGKTSIESIRSAFEPIETGAGAIISAEILAGLPGCMRRNQAVFDQTGGLHAAGLFDERGMLLVLREDVGRHNAVDKVMGRALLDGLLPLSRHVLLVSGRVSFEIMQKALAGRVGIVAAVSAPTALAVRFARESGQTLIGFLRGNRMNIYTSAERVGVNGRV